MLTVQRTITILLPDDADLRHTLTVFQSVQKRLSPLCYNHGKPIGALQLQREQYHAVKGLLNSQMTIMAMRLVSGAYVSARKGYQRRLALEASRKARYERKGWTYKPRFVKEPGLCDFDRPTAMFLVGCRGRDADDNSLFVSGKAHKVRNKRSRQTRKRLQSKLASRKAHNKDTRSVRRLLKRQGRKNSNRTRTFAQTVSKQVCQWVKPDSILVLEDLNIPLPQKGTIQGKSLRRRLSLWQFGLMRQCIENKAQMLGLKVTTVNPAYTSQTCNRCGLLGIRKRHKFVCPHCGHAEHADVNAARNVRDRFVVSRHDGVLSMTPEALSTVQVARDEGKPFPLGSGS